MAAVLYWKWRWRTFGAKWRRYCRWSYSELVGSHLFASAAELTLTVGFIAYDAGRHDLAGWRAKSFSQFSGGVKGVGVPCRVGVCRGGWGWVAADLGPGRVLSWSR